MPRPKNHGSALVGICLQRMLQEKHKWFKALRTIKKLPSGQCFSKSEMTENFGQGRNDIHREF